MEIAVLITCHNRRTSTLRCLQSLINQDVVGRDRLTVYLVDDGSTDGTGDAVRENFPDVKIIQGDGDLYWNQGMRLAWRMAAKADYDGYLWLNDDVELLPGALKMFLTGLKKQKSENIPPSIITGPCRGLESAIPSYGGIDDRGRVIFHESELRNCSTMNGNVVLIPASIFRTVGGLDPSLQHAYGDYDYGFRVRAAGYNIMSVPGWIGLCEAHGEGKWSDKRYSLRERWRHFHSPNGLYPKDFFIYQRRRKGIFLAILYVANAYRRMLFGVNRRKS